MTTLAEFLYPVPARRSVGAIVGWWERRRLGYNLFVGTAGVLSLAAMTVIASVPPGIPGVSFHWGPILAFEVLAHACYLRLVGLAL